MQYLHLLSKYRIPIAAGVIFLLGISIYSVKNHRQIEDVFIESMNSNQGLQMIETVNPAESNNPDSLAEVGSNKSIEEESIVIDVAGEVIAPAVYVLPAGTRIYQAVEAAGGLGPKADTSTVNLAAVLQDGTKLYIPKKNETEIPVIQTSSPVQGTFSESGLINLNTADSTELQKLSGVGPATAEKILAYRREYGQFNKIEDLMNVSGIGEKTFAKLKSQICVQ